jgi:hypothetical protein
MRLSSPRQWPLTSSPSDPIDCRGFSYDHDANDEFDRYTPETTSGDDELGQSRVSGRGRHGFRLLLSREPRGAPVPCRLPGGQLNNYSVTFRCASDTVVDCIGCAAGGCGSGPGDCQGSLAETESGTTLRLTLSGCSHQTNRTEYIFDCRQSSRLVPSKDLVIVVSSTVPTTIITSTNESASWQQQQQQQQPPPPPLSLLPSQSNRTVYHCWAFPNGGTPSLSVFYLFDGSRCDDAMRLIDFTEGMRIDNGLSKSSSTSPSASLFDSPSALALATFTSKPRRSPRKEEDLAAVSVASGSRTVHSSSVPRNSAGYADAAGVSSTTARSHPSAVGATGTGTDFTAAAAANVIVVFLSVSLAFAMWRCP